MIIGGHVSIAGGISKSVDRAQERGFNAMQIFVSSPRSFNASEHLESEIELFHKKYVEAKMRALFFHAIYLVNLGSPKDFIQTLSLKSLTYYLEMGEKLGVKGTIVHVGNTDIDRIAEGIKEILAETPENQQFIVEFMATPGRIISTIEEGVYILEKVNSNRVKFCVDTQHIFAFGVDVTKAEVISQWLERFSTYIGLENIACIHINDSKTACGSHHDRHENIGQGQIGVAGLEVFFADKRLHTIPLILETPGLDGKGPDIYNRNLLAGVLGEEIMTQSTQDSSVPLFE